MDDLTETERDALHDLQLGVEHVHRAHGHLLAFHHRVGHAMDRLADAESKLRAAGHDEYADCLRDDLLPSGIGGTGHPTGETGDVWTYELLELFVDGVLADVTEFEHEARDDLAGGRRHVTERDQQRRWRERANWSDAEE